MYHAAPSCKERNPWGLSRKTYLLYSTCIAGKVKKGKGKKKKKGHLSTLACIRASAIGSTNKGACDEAARTLGAARNRFRPDAGYFSRVQQRGSHRHTIMQNQKARRSLITFASWSTSVSPPGRTAGTQSRQTPGFSGHNEERLAQDSEARRAPDTHLIRPTRFRKRPEP